MLQKKVEISNLRVNYNDTIALKGISFDIYDKETIGIIGPAQSGKTTLLKTLNRTIKLIPTARVKGKVKVDGVDVSSIKDVNRLRRKVGMVFPLPVGLPYLFTITSLLRHERQGFVKKTN